MIRLSRLIGLSLVTGLLAACDGGSSSSSSDRPELVLAAESAEHQVTLSWSGYETADIYYSTDPDCDWDNYTHCTGSGLVIDVPSGYRLGVGDESLTLDAAHYFVVESNGRRSNAVGARPWQVSLDGPVTAVAVDDEVVYVGGEFGRYGALVGGGAPLATDNGKPLGTLPFVEGTVYAVAPDGDGGWFLGGDFTAVGGLSRENLAHVSAVGVVSDWNPGTNGRVRTLAVADDAIYAGGSFSVAGNCLGSGCRSHLAAFDRDGDLLDWNPGTDGAVNALVIHEGVIYAGGNFRRAGGCEAWGCRDRLAAFTPEGELAPWNPGASSRVNALTIADGVIYAGGIFAQAGGCEGASCRRYLAAFDTKGELLSWAPEVDREINALAVADGIVYAGGRFTRAEGCPEGGGCRQHLAAFDLEGHVTPWNPGADGEVHSLVAHDGVIYAGGEFSQAGGCEVEGCRGGLAAFYPDGELAAWNPGLDYEVYALAVAGDALYVGGDLEFVAGGRREHLAAFSREGVLTAWNPGANGVVNALAIGNEAIYAGGGFTQAGGCVQPDCRQHLAAFTPDGSLNYWNPGANNFVHDLIVVDNIIYAGGAFDRAGSTDYCRENGCREGLAAFDSAGALQTWNPGVGGAVHTLVAHDETLYVGGSFQTAGGCDQPGCRQGLAAFDLGDDDSLKGWAPVANDLVRALTVQDGYVYVGGRFDKAGAGIADKDRDQLAAFDLYSGIEPWNPGAGGGTVHSLATAGLYIFAGGEFPDTKECRSDLCPGYLAAFNANGHLMNWDAEVDGPVRVMEIVDGVIFAGGDFESVGGLPRLHFSAIDAGTGQLLW
ncbi:hypothetical protein CAI21_10125 [Alkalilimnicola ehrlichii]|uniref:Uncharacterized protein n=1 Tax=Alkalilimnicola ehrlichii TaxID=351052 RepID=A0A3E0WJ82_9GAMM|nr:PQQ-binding-like beta-propeller repeat protein [Alkalilimnicola ehrlichii]RFA29407.1 hypothetical protein CAI21_10125 [Alkalilimnicola ehrlichii]RFA31925.1 hypothetical protein CAL65_20970 [Alkalilimnicola ehrlichii]